MLIVEVTTTMKRLGQPVARTLSAHDKHLSQLGHGDTSAAEPLHPAVNGTKLGSSFVFQTQIKHRKCVILIVLSIVFIRPFPVAAFPALKFAGEGGS